MSGAVRGFAMMMPGMGADEDEAEPPLPQPEAAADTLRERLAALLEEPETPFERGDLVVMKPGFSFFGDKDRDRIPLIVVDTSVAGYAIPVVTPSSHGRRYDIVLMLLERDGSSPLLITDRRLVHRWQDPEAVGAQAQAG